MSSLNYLIGQNKEQFYLYFSAFFTLLVCLAFSSQTLLQIIIIFGQAHFFITYFYKNKSGKLDKKYIGNFLYLAFLLFFLTYFLVYNLAYVNYYIFLTTMIFVLHYFYDELKIFNFSDKNFKSIAVLSVFASFLSFFFVKVLGISVSAIWPLVFISLAMFFYLQFLLYKTSFSLKVKDNLAMYIFTSLNVLVPIVLMFTNVHMLKITAFIIIFHYIRWYLYYYERFSTMVDKKELNFYLDVVLWLHILIVSLFVVYTIDTKNGFLYILFNPIFFYTWTLIHIFLSIRKEDYQFFLGNKI